MLAVSDLNQPKIRRRFLYVSLELTQQPTIYDT